MPSKVTIGHKYSKEAIRFLNFPTTTRQDVLSSLGPPFLEVCDAGVLLYAWETTERGLLFFIDDFDGDTMEARADKKSGRSREWGLFIAYNTNGFVAAHEVRRIDTKGLEEACVAWRCGKGIRQ